MSREGEGFVTSVTKCIVGMGYEIGKENVAFYLIGSISDHFAMIKNNMGHKLLYTISHILKFYFIVPQPTFHNFI